MVRIRTRIAVTHEVMGKNELLPQSVAKQLAKITIIEMISRHEEA